jgi:hypothetical protein
MSTTKITAAATATDQVEAEITKALEDLNPFDGRIVNGFGIYADVYRQRAALAAAREAIERAERIMQKTVWPTDEDYDAA